MDQRLIRPRGSCIGLARKARTERGQRHRGDACTLTASTPVTMLRVTHAARTSTELLKRFSRPVQLVQLQLQLLRRVTRDLDRVRISWSVCPPSTTDPEPESRPAVRACLRTKSMAGGRQRELVLSSSLCPAVRRPRLALRLRRRLTPLCSNALDWAQVAT